MGRGEKGNSVPIGRWHSTDTDGFVGKQVRRVIFYRPTVEQWNVFCYFFTLSSIILFYSFESL